jgi:outer membrane protein assembly factor BamB
MKRTSWVVLVLTVVVSGCAWGQYRAGPEHTGFQQFEGKISTANVGTLQESWRADDTGSSVVVGNTVYTGALNGLVALDATGTTNCSGSPRRCRPLWSAAMPFNVRGAPAVMDGVVYVTSGDGMTAVVAAFDAAGVQQCGGSPKTCSPLWLGVTSGALNGSPTVASGKVYIESGDDVIAFDAAGVRNCTPYPRFCAPVWSAHTLDQVVGAPTVVDGVVYVGSWDSHLYAYDAAGFTGCSGSPTVCSPLWTATLSGPIYSTPAVSGGVVYVGNGNQLGTSGTLYAFDAHGVTGCAGTPRVCAPLWTASADGNLGSPAVGAGRLFVSSNQGTLYAFDAAGVSGCSGTPKRCTPRWTVPSAVGADAPIIANDVVYVPTGLDLRAYDAAGALRCSGTPKVCQPLWTSPVISGIGVYDPSVADGRVFVSAWTGTLYAFALPA